MPEGRLAPNNANDWPWRAPNEASYSHLPVAHTQPDLALTHLSELFGHKIGKSDLLADHMHCEMQQVMQRQTCWAIRWPDVLLSHEETALNGDGPKLNAGGPSEAALDTACHARHCNLSKAFQSQGISRLLLNHAPASSCIATQHIKQMPVFLIQTL